MPAAKTDDRIETTYIMGRSGREASTYARTLDVLAEFFENMAPGGYWIRRRLWRLRFASDQGRAAGTVCVGPEDVEVVEEADWGVVRVDGRGAFSLTRLAEDGGSRTYDEHDEDGYRRAREDRRRRWMNSTLPGPGRDG